VDKPLLVLIYYLVLFLFFLTFQVLVFNWKSYSTDGGRDDASSKLPQSSASYELELGLLHLSCCDTVGIHRNMCLPGLVVDSS